MEWFLLQISGAALALALVVLRDRLAGFAAQRPRDYAGSGNFDLRRDLAGPFLCEGVIFGPTGRVTARFVADMEARWEGDIGSLRESFSYDSGARQERAWRLTLGNDGAIRAEAADVVGTGHGRQAGGAVQLRYRLRLPADAGGHVLDVNDWMYRTGNGTIINRSQFRKFGITVAELVATMRRVDAA